MPQRNDPCPCGSGKKYKRCHMEKDAATRPELRLLRGMGAEPQGIARSIGDRPIQDVWQADVTPLAAHFGDDPSARPVAVIVVAGEFVLHADITSHPSAEPALVASQLAAALEAAMDATGRVPATVEVRYDVLATALRRTLATRRIKVRASFTLDLLDRAVADLDRHMGIPADAGLRTRISRPETWAGWGLDAGQIGRLFGACAAYYRAAPWEHIVNDDVIRAKVAGGSAWSASVMGNAGELFGLAMYARAEDLDALLDGEPGEPAESMGRMRGAVLSLSFDHRDEVERRMRQEVRDSQWEVAGPSAWPGLLVMNTPGGGITAHQMEELIAVVRAIPRFAAKHEAVLAGSAVARFPLRWRDTENKVSLVFESSEELIGGDESDTAAAIAPEVEAQAVRAFYEKHYREWLDIPVPALGDRTPRHAARLKTVRPMLIELLKSIERQGEQALPDGSPAYDATWMWQELGLERARRRLPPRTH
jgi:hypothetical protein